MRAPLLRIHADELIVDNFAGGGGASLGIEWALGRSPDIAVNHDPEAVAMHAANHPHTRHLCGNVWDVDPVGVTNGRPVGLAWFSPDCTFHSKARGKRPLRDPKSANGRRGLAWVVTRWARAVRPRVIILENVEEFQHWGPLGPDGLPDPSRAGFTFRRWMAQLVNLGYAVEFRQLRASDYGAPTIRRRLFLIARCDGQPISWPTPTHGPGMQPFRTAAECINWETPCPSIFERARPLAEATLARIGRGMWRFVLGTQEPFVTPLTHAGDLRSHGVSDPMRTITAAHRGEHALVAPTLIQTGYGERVGQAPRSLDLHTPLGTVMAEGCKWGLVAAFLSKHYGGARNDVSPSGVACASPLGTVTTVDHHGLVAAHLCHLRGTARDGRSLAQPVPTVTAGGTHLAEVRAFLLKYNGTGGARPLSKPLDTVVTHDRFGLVTVSGQDYAIADIGMRMLQPRELFRAQGFSDEYVIDVEVDGEKLSKTAQIRMCGNSVSPVVAQALVEANFARAVRSTRQMTLGIEGAA